MEDAVIEIQSLQDGQEVSYLLTDGKFSECGNDTYIEFDGSDAYGTAGEKFKLHIKGNDMFSMISGDDAESEFVIERGVKHYRSVAAPNETNDILIGVDAQRISSTIGSNGGVAEVKYIMDYNHNTSVINEMKVSVRSRNI